MNILFVSDIYSFQGGNAVSVERISTGLANKGHNISIVTSKNDILEEKRKEQKIYEIENGFWILDKNLKARLCIPTKTEIINIFTEANPDIVIVCTPTPMGYMMMRYAKKNNIPIIFWNHAMPEQAGLFFRTILLRNKVVEYLLYKIMLWLYNQGDAVICPTEFALGLLKENGLKTTGHVISNGIDAQKFKKTCITPKQFNILYVGRLSPEKNIETLINTFDELYSLCPESHLYIVGAGCHENNLKSLSITKPSSQNTHFTGYVDDKKLLELYSIASVFVMPSSTELESISTLEAMSHNLPIIVANNKLSAARFFVTSWENGFLFNNETELLYRLTILQANRNLAIHIGKHSRQLAEEHDISKSIDNFEEVINNIISTRRQKKC